MAAYGGRTPKRHVMYSNSRAIGGFDMGKLCFNYKDPSYNHHRTTKKTVSIKNGKKKVAFQGVKKSLKASQYLVSTNRFHWASLGYILKQMDILQWVFLWCSCLVYMMHCSSQPIIHISWVLLYGSLERISNTRMWLI